MAPAITKEPPTVTWPVVCSVLKKAEARFPSTVFDTVNFGELIFVFAEIVSTYSVPESDSVVAVTNGALIEVLDCTLSVYVVPDTLIVAVFTLVLACNVLT